MNLVVIIESLASFVNNLFYIQNYVTSVLLPQEKDQGAYSCEGINSRGSTFAIPDTILTIKEPVNTRGSCLRGTFNDLALTRSDCINCFCFGVSTQCKSANLFTFQVNSLSWLSIHPLIRFYFHWIICTYHLNWDSKTKILSEISKCRVFVVDTKYQNSYIYKELGGITCVL